MKHFLPPQKWRANGYFDSAYMAVTGEVLKYWLTSFRTVVALAKILIFLKGVTRTIFCNLLINQVPARQKIYGRAISLSSRFVRTLMQECWSWSSLQAHTLPSVTILNYKRSEKLKTTAFVGSGALAKLRCNRIQVATSYIKILRTGFFEAATCREVEIVFSQYLPLAELDFEGDNLPLTVSDLPYGYVA